LLERARLAVSTLSGLPAALDRVMFTIPVRESGIDSLKLLLVRIQKKKAQFELFFPGEIDMP